MKVTGDPVSWYRDRFEEYTLRIAGTRKRIRRLAFIRLFLFLATVALVVVATRWNITAILLILLAGIASFLALVIKYVKLQHALRRQENLAEINSNELKALAGDFSMYADGSEFEDPDHPFAADLDIFGPRCLFQYLNRSATGMGKECLAGWLSNPMVEHSGIRMRQEAVGELSAMPDFRQEFLSTGYLLRENATEKSELLQWIHEPAKFLNPGFLFYLIIVPLLTATVITLAILSVISPVWILLYHVVPFGLLTIYQKTYMKKYRALSKKAELVKKYSELLLLIEKEKFSSPEMAQLRSMLDGRHGLPSGSTRKLSAILNAFDARNNLIVGYLLNFFFLWDFIQVRRLERWQARHRDELPKWLDALAHADALCSLANFRFNNPESIFPEVKDDDYLINAADLGHPLIPPGNRTNNPIILLSRRHFTIVSGANMAGKSTYLRTVGVNMVLAMAGSAVIAGKMTFAPVSLVTSIRTRDSLQKNESYFYAELKRLKVIMERLERGERLLILLDEILKGTNSRDKQSGSFALLEKLLRFDACGLVATHDLALGELEKTYPGNISNKCFEVVIENDALVFDYKLKDGIARQMNATFLMKKMGIID